MRRNLLNVLLAIVFASPVWAQNTVCFTEHSIDDNFTGISTVCSIDIDNDGLKDLVCGSETTSASSLSIGLWWLRNNGDATWTRHEIDGGFANVMSVEIVDLDKNGHPDVLASGWNAHQIAYWKNSGGTIPTWTKVVVKANFNNAHDAHALDVDQDSLIDIVGVSANLGQVVIWYQKEDGGFSEQTIDNSFPGVRAVALADYNNDGNIDVSAVSATKNQLTVYYADNQNPVVWTKEIINSTLNGAHEVIGFDADNDGDVDMLTSAYNSNQIDIWKNNGANPVVWTREPVGCHIGVNRALPADFDGDGDFDVVATGKYPTSKLSIWWNQGGIPNTYSETIINDQLLAFWALCVDDFDNDGDLDFFAGASVSGALRWWENNLITGLNDEPGNSDETLKVFPNPATRGCPFTIANGRFGCTDIQLVNLAGETVLSKKMIKTQKNVQVDLKNHDLLPGMYYIKVQSDSGFQCKKIIVL